MFHLYYMIFKKDCQGHSVWEWTNRLVAWGEIDFLQFLRYINI